MYLRKTLKERMHQRSICTFMPKEAKRLAMHSPIPDEAPVTTATRPAEKAGCAAAEAEADGYEDAAASSFSRAAFSALTASIWSKRAATSAASSGDRLFICYREACQV